MCTDLRKEKRGADQQGLAALFAMIQEEVKSLTGDCRKAMTAALTAVDSVSGMDEQEGLHLRANFARLGGAPSGFQAFVLAMGLQFHSVTESISKILEESSKKGLNVDTVSAGRSFYKAPLGVELYQLVHSARSAKEAYGSMCAALGLDPSKTIEELPYNAVMSRGSQLIASFGVCQACTRKLQEGETRHSVIESMLHSCEVKGHHVNAKLVKEAIDLAEQAGGDQANRSFFEAHLKKVLEREAGTAAKVGAGAVAAEANVESAAGGGAQADAEVAEVATKAVDVA